MSNQEQHYSVSIIKALIKNHQWKDEHCDHVAVRASKEMGGLTFNASFDMPKQRYLNLSIHGIDVDCRKGLDSLEECNDLAQKFNSMVDKSLNLKRYIVISNNPIFDAFERITNVMPVAHETFIEVTIDNSEPPIVHSEDGSKDTIFFSNEFLINEPSFLYLTDSKIYIENSINDFGIDEDCLIFSLKDECELVKKYKHANVDYIKEELNSYTESLSMTVEHRLHSNGLKSQSNQGVALQIAINQVNKLINGITQEDLKA